MAEAFVNAFVRGSNVVLVKRVGDKREFTRIPADYVTYHVLDDMPHDLGRSLRSSENVLSITREKKWLRITWKHPFSRGGSDWLFDPRRFMCQDDKSPFNTRKLTTYEGDVDPVLRAFVDSNGQYAIQKPRRAYFDLETDSRVSFSRKEEMRILCWCIEDTEGNTWSGVLEEDTDEAEKKLLIEFWSIAMQFDQHCAWNLDRFDKPVLFARSEARGLDVDPELCLWLDHLVVHKRMNVTASESGDEKTSLKLEDVAQSILGEGKDEFNASQTWFAWAQDGSCSDTPCKGCGKLHEHSGRECMRRYCAKDTALLSKLEKKTGYLELFFTVCESCGIFPDSVSTNPTHQVDAFMLRLGKERSIHFRTRRFGDEVETFAGAYVMEPGVTGIARNVHVCDFARLYPSIILTWNMSPETKIGVINPTTMIVKKIDGTSEPMKPDWTRAPRTNVVFDTTVDGILVVALREMIRLRVYWNDLKANLTPGTPEWVEADRRSTGYKITANAFFGVASSPFSRYYDPQVGESITQTGVELLLTTKSWAETSTWKIKVVGADTDSLFGMGVDSKRFGEFVSWCNVELYPDFAKQHGCKTFDLKLAYEKEFERIVFVGKKRYAGRYLHYKGKPAAINSKPEIKGLEFKRGDTSKLGRILQESVIKLLLGNWNPACSSCGHLRAAHEDKDPAPCKACDKCKKFTGTYDLPTEELEHYHSVVSTMRTRILEGPITASECVISKSIAKHLPPTVKEIEVGITKLRERAEKKGEPFDVVQATEAFINSKASDESYKARKKDDGTRMALPPHVQVALLLKDRGEEMHTGTKVGYVVVDGSVSPMKVIPASDFDGTQADRFYLWENLVWPPTARLLEAAFPLHDWSSWKKVRPKKERKKRAIAAFNKQIEDELERLLPAESAPKVEGVPSVPKTPRKRKAKESPVKEDRQLSIPETPRQSAPTGDGRITVQRSDATAQWFASLSSRPSLVEMKHESGSVLLLTFEA